MEQHDDGGPARQRVVPGSPYEPTIGFSRAFRVGDRIYVSRAHADALGHVRPAATMVVVAALLDPRWSVEIEVDAVIS